MCPEYVIFIISFFHPEEKLSSLLPSAQSSDSLATSYHHFNQNKPK